MHIIVIYLLFRYGFTETKYTGHDMITHTKPGRI